MRRNGSPLVQARKIRLSEIVREYKSGAGSSRAREIEFFGRKMTLQTAISLAALSRDENGNKQQHQWRIPPTSLKKAEEILRDNKRLLARSSDFDSLHNTVGHLIDPIYKIGPLTIFDISLRLGVYLKLRPNTVYIHAGVSDGARALGFGGRKTINREEFPKPLRSLEAHEIENFLCIYKRRLFDLKG